MQLSFALLLGAALFGLCVWWTLADMIYAIAGDKVTASVVYGQVFGPVLTGRLVGFAIAAVALHLSFGLLAYALAALTAAAAPRFAEGRRLWLILAWFLALGATALMANAAWFPASHFAPEESWLLSSWQGLRPVHVVLALQLLLIFALALRAVQAYAPARKVACVTTGAVFLLVAASFAHRAIVAAPAPLAYDQPHIVILGLDSLRSDLAGASTDEPLTPHVDKFLAGAHRFGDAISPLARTYPALVSLLTGRHPVTSNARFNLMPRTLVREGETLGGALRARGYHGVYATDEVRFANFDESFGFDQLITPPVGASDFMLGKFGDLPLVNLLSSTRIGARVFPSVHANRAAYVTYRPGNFIARIKREFVPQGPQFLFIHMTLSHWPYSWAGLAKPTTPQQYRPAYRQAVEEVDRQFGGVMQLLERKGVLDNAFVVVLSDHGEALGGPTDSMLRKTGTPSEIWNSLWGHGTSVLSPHQYTVLLAMRGYGRARIPGTPELHAWPVSLEDVRPTLQELATGAAPTGVDGISLVPLLRDPAFANALVDRVRFTETDFNTPMVLAGKYTESGLIHEGAAYYEIVPKTGWVQLRDERLPELMLQKQRAALSRDSLLAAIPNGKSATLTYLFTNRHTPLPRRLEGRPDPMADPEAARLWDALHARFPGELVDIPHVPRL